MSRNRGGQPGNQNARKHGYYSNRLDAAQKRDCKSVSLAEGLDQEITLMRIKLKAIIAKDPDNHELFIRATRCLAKAVVSRYKIRKSLSRSSLTEPEIPSRPEKRIAPN